ncbi:MAG: hypothetical protein AVO33_06525 [delta proteobacterium ML8_F1]|nr:MAG: hypothetical protein AVO33_06525 [delta proteobacterium ML8_F1]
MLLFVNGTIHTMDPLNPHPEALLAHNGRILDLGSLRHIQEKHPGATLVDMKGKTLLPGFNDSHLHLLGIGMRLNQIDLSSVESIEALKEKLLRHQGDGDILVGYGWNQEHFKEGRMPSSHDLDATGILKPIIIHRTCVHMLVANTLAMEKAGVFEPSGLFKESGMNPLKDLVPPPDEKALAGYILSAAKVLLSHGVTSVQSDDLFMVDTSLHQLVFDVYETLERENRLPLRVYEQTNFKQYEDYLKNIPDYRQDRTSDRRFKRGPVKILGDGSLGGRTARLKEPYSDDTGTRGLLNFSPEAVRHLFQLCDEHQLDVAVHAIGDEMLQIALEALEPLKHAACRHSIIHCQVTDTETLAALDRLKPVLHIQPGFLNGDIHMAPSRLGPKRLRTAYNYKTLENLDLVIAFGTDAPVESTNPFLGIYHAVTRKDLKGFPQDGWLPGQTLSLYDAIKHYTVDGAYASYDENKKGALKAGYYADFILVDRDPFTVAKDDLKDLRVLETFVGGQSVYPLD